MKVQKSAYRDICARKRRTPRFFSISCDKDEEEHRPDQKHCFGGWGGQSFNTAVFYLVSLDTINVNITFVICKTSNKEEKNLKPQLVF